MGNLEKKILNPNVTETLHDRKREQENLENWIENLEPEDLLMVHITNTAPSVEEGSLFIRTHLGHHLKHNKPLQAIRNTIHFTLNGAVVEQHDFTSGFTGKGWQNRDFAILSPFEKIPKSRFLRVSPEDSIIAGDFKIPEGSVILCNIKSLAKLVENGIVEQLEMENILKNSQSLSPGKKLKFEKYNVTFLIDDFSKKNTRNVVSETSTDLGYRYNAMGKYGWAGAGFLDSGIPSEFLQKHDYPDAPIHQEHWTANLERVFGYWNYWLENDLNTLKNWLSKENVNSYAVDDRSREIRTKCESLEAIIEGGIIRGFGNSKGNLSNEEIKALKKTAIKGIKKSLNIFNKIPQKYRDRMDIRSGIYIGDLEEKLGELLEKLGE